MKALFPLLFMAILAGAVLPIQAGLNHQMEKKVGDPVYAAFISFVVGSIGLLGYMLFKGTPLNRFTDAFQAHWTVWIAGFLGAFYVASVIILVPRLGAALTFGLVIAGQLGLSLLLDHYGLLDLPTHIISWQRLVGILFIIGGVILIRNY